MPKDFEGEVFAHIAKLKEINQRLLTALKQCVIVLAQIEPVVPAYEGIQETLGVVNEIINVAEAETVDFEMQ